MLEIQKKFVYESYCPAAGGQSAVAEPVYIDNYEKNADAAHKLHDFFKCP